MLQRIPSDVITKERHRFMWGQPYPRLLHTFFYHLPLVNLGIAVQEPIDVLNFILERVEYNSDQQAWGQSEYWLQSTEECIQVLRKLKRGDCEDTTILVCSILYSWGNTDALFFLGHHGEDDGMINHAYVMYPDPTFPMHPWVLETTWEQAIHRIGRIDEMKNYHHRFGANARGEYYEWVD